MREIHFLINLAALKTFFRKVVFLMFNLMPQSSKVLIQQIAKIGKSDPSHEIFAL